MNIEQLNIVELEVNASRTSLTGTAVDLRTFEGKGHIILSSSAATAGTTPTLDVKLTESATSGGSYTDVTGGAFTQVTDGGNRTEMIPFDFSASKGFVKVVATYGGTSSPAFTFSVSAVGFKKAGRNAAQTFTDE